MVSPLPSRYGMPREVRDGVDGVWFWANEGESDYQVCSMDHKHFHIVATTTSRTHAMAVVDALRATSTGRDVSPLTVTERRALFGWVLDRLGGVDEDEAQTLTHALAYAADWFDERLTRPLDPLRNSIVTHLDTEWVRLVGLRPDTDQPTTPVRLMPDGTIRLLDGEGTT